MKSKKEILFFVTSIILILNIFIVFKTRVFIGYSFDNIEALAEGETFFFHTNCINDITEEIDGYYYVYSCNEKNDGKIYECKYVDSSVRFSTDYGICYTMIVE